MGFAGRPKFTSYVSAGSDVIELSFSWPQIDVVNWDAFIRVSCAVRISRAHDVQPEG